MSELLRQATEAARVLAERRANDGLRLALKDWDEEDPEGLFPHQRGFLMSDKSQAWLFGANRSGKTEALAIAVATFLRFGVLDPREAYAPGFKFTGPKRVWCISLTSDLARNIFQPKLFNNGARIDSRPALIPDDEIASWNITNQTLVLKNGSICIFKSDDAGYEVFQGADIDLAAFDEVCSKTVYDETTLRIGAGRRLLIRGAATILPPPGTPGGVRWIFRTMVTPWLELGGSNKERNAASPKIDIFTAGMADNRAIDPDEIDRLASIFPPGSPEYLIRVLGHLLPSIGGTLVYKPFRKSYHVLSGLVLHPYLPLCLNVDFNAANGVWTVGQRVGRVFRFLDEITMEDSSIAPMVHEFRTRYPAHQAEIWIHGDNTARRAEHQTGLSSFHLIGQYMAGYPAPIRYNLADVNPPQRDRVDAVNLQLRPPTGERLIEIDGDRCPNLVADFEGTIWDKRMKIDKKNGPRSDGADTAGYWIHYAQPARAQLVQTTNLRSIKSPRYGTKSPFPFSRSNRRLYVRGMNG